MEAYEAYELPLVFFTVFTQWGIGILWALACLDVCGPRPPEGQGPDRLRRLCAGAAFVLALAGALLSVLHLGSPHDAPGVFRGLAHSWLSMEVLAVAVFMALLFLWTCAEFARRTGAWMRGVLLGLACLAGLALVLISAQVYADLPSHPFWRGPLTHLNFAGSALVLGFLTVGSLFRLTRPQPESPPAVLTFGVAAGALCLCAVLLSYGQGLGGGAGAEMAAGARRFFGTPLLLGPLCFVFLIPALLGGYLRLRRALSGGLVVAAVLLLGISALCARMLFYASVMGLQPWF